MRHVLTIILYGFTFLGFGSPVKGNLGGMHSSFIPKPEGGISAKSYIQDGLVAQYDGIENVAYGRHDSTTKYWYDLTKHEDPFHCIYVQRMYWGENYMFSTGHVLNTAIPRDYSANGFTYEMVTVQAWTKPSFGSQPMRQNLFGFNWMTGDNRYRAAVMGSSTGVMFNNKNWPLCFNERTFTAVLYPDGQGNMYIGGLNYVYPVTDASHPCNLTSSSMALWIGPNNGAWENPGINAVRLYNRALSEEEVEWNHAVDVLRFGIE